MALQDQSGMSISCFPQGCTLAPQSPGHARCRRLGALEATVDLDSLFTVCVTESQSSTVIVCQLDVTLHLRMWKLEGPVARSSLRGGGGELGKLKT